ncbi:MAG: hypothetical protein AAF570_07025, partial [Bacteroidota bacterium]
MTKERIGSVIYFLLTGMIVCGAAFFNKYPLVTDASAGFMESSFILEAPHGQPFGYPLYLRITGWQSTFWPAIIYQGFLLNFLLIRTIRLLVPTIPWRALHFPMVIGLALLSSMSWMAGALLPAIFLSILLLSVFLFFADQDRRPIHLLPTGFLIFTAVVTETSHIFFAILLVLCLLAYGRARRHATEKLTDFRWRNYTLLSIVVLACLSIPVWNAFDGQGFAPHLRLHMHLNARMDAHGLLQEALPDHCQGFDNPNPVCGMATFKLKQDRAYFAHRDSFWTSTEAWEDPQNHYHALAGDLFGRHWLTYFVNGVTDGLSGLARQNVRTAFGLMRRGAPPHTVMQRRLRHEYRHFMNSRQNQGGLPKPFLFFLHLPVMLLSAGYLLWHGRKGDLPLNWRFFLWLLVLGIGLNALVQGILMGPDVIGDAKLGWLLPFAAGCLW